MSSHSDRLEILAQLCHERDVNPSKGNYANFVRSIVCGKMFLSNQTAIQITKTLTTAYYTDRWQSLLKDLNQGLPIISGSTVTPLEIKTESNIEKPKTKIITAKQKAQNLQGTARRDTYNNVGRNTQYDLNELELSLDEALQLWQEFYPKYDAEIKGNCILIYWDTKAELRSQRDLQKTVQPTMPKISSPEGDIIDDTYDETAPEVKN
jgi:hypothetical protein